MNVHTTLKEVKLKNKGDVQEEVTLKHQGPVLIFDFGSQYTQLVARRIRECGVYAEIHPWTLSTIIENVHKLNPSAIVLSGGPNSVFEDHAPFLNKDIFSLNVPVFGICYGLQLLAHTLGGRVEKAKRGEYGPRQVQLANRREGLLSRISSTKKESLVWMSHGDRVLSMPENFEVLGETEETPFAIVADLKRNIYGVQFHPEVQHSEDGTCILQSFLFDIAKLKQNWTGSALSRKILAEIGTQIGSSYALCGLSGGVDSAVAAALVSNVIGAHLFCVFVDNGLLREGERDEIEAAVKKTPHLELIVVDASSEFLTALRGISDPEEKRKTIGRLFIEVFEREARKIEKQRNIRIEFLVQGTLYTDVIESTGVHGPSAVIKSHHNVGGLPEKMNMGLCEPLRSLFKDEVRNVGQELGLPDDLLFRQPFPGPGLAIRCIGNITKKRLATLRQADTIWRGELKTHGLSQAIWQSFVVLLPVKTVGVMGDLRTYANVLALRAVTSEDGMTADWARLPHDFLALVSTKIVNEVPGINRVVYDISSKPPATIEWE